MSRRALSICLATLVASACVGTVGDPQRGAAGKPRTHDDVNPSRDPDDPESPSSEKPSTDAPGEKKPGSEQTSRDPDHPTSAMDAGTTTGGDTKPAPEESSELAAGPPNLSIAEQCSDSTLRGSSQEGVRRLTRTELSRVLQTTFPGLFFYYVYPRSYYEPSSDIMADYPADVPEDPNENFNPMHSEAQVTAWMEAADYWAGKVANSDKERVHYGGMCMSQTTIDQSCWTGFVANLGRVLFRRPLANDEVAQIVGAVPSGDVKAAIQSVVSHLLRSPNTVFHLILGAPDGDGRVRLTDHEVAERLAFGLTSAPPDETLSQAVDKGELKTLDQVRAQATRLMATDLAKDRVRNFVDEWLRVYRIPRPPETQGLEGWEANTVELDGFYKEEIFDFVQHVVWAKNGTFSDLMTMPVAFPTERKLADVYGAEPSTKGVPVPSADHPGLILRAGFMASGLDTTSPILRGVTVLRRVLCNVLPSPDPTVVATRLIELNALDPKTMPTHAIVSQVTSPAKCQACHSMINPVGFLLEAFSPLGVRRTVQDYVGPNPGYGAKLWATFPLPGPQMLSIGGEPPKTYSNPNDLVADIAESPQAEACMAVRLFRSINQRPERGGDACALADVISTMKDGKPLLEVFARAVANEDIFWRKAP